MRTLLRRAKPAARRRLSFRKWPAAVYAIGDVHGCLNQLLALEKQIIRDARSTEGEKWIVMLGDYVDRGPDSGGVIQHLLEPLPKGWKRFCLIGNHEQMMLDYLGDPQGTEYWLDQGGLATLASYGAAPRPDEPAEAGTPVVIPKAHLKFLATLPIALTLPGWVFVHAGLRPGIPFAGQADEDLTLIRSPFLEAEPFEGFCVVHGHTPGREPSVTPARIGIDTHCFWSGRLTSVRILPDGTTRFFTASG